MLQTWILRADVDPVSAWQTGRDYSVCGPCTLRHSAQAGSGGCYVVKRNAPMQVYSAWLRGRYRAHTRKQLAAVTTGRGVRIGSYGDPAAVPTTVWSDLLVHALLHTGYTHHPYVDPELAVYCMASVETHAQRTEAKALGYRTFRIKPRGTRRTRGEARCPAAAESGHRLTCLACPIRCDGLATGRTLDVVANAHGPLAGAHWRT
jgi:hypothetical protein